MSLSTYRREAAVSVRRAKKHEVNDVKSNRKFEGSLWGLMDFVNVVFLIFYETIINAFIRQNNIEHV
jgi:hypothetical protein